MTSFYIKKRGKKAYSKGETTDHSPIFIASLLTS